MWLESVKQPHFVVLMECNEVQGFSIIVQRFSVKTEKLIPWLVQAHYQAYKKSNHNVLISYTHCVNDAFLERGGGEVADVSIDSDELSYNRMGIVKLSYNRMGIVQLCNNHMGIVELSNNRVGIVQLSYNLVGIVDG